MLGDFLFSESPVPDEIQVVLLFDPDGTRAARLVLPAAIEAEMAAGGYPAVHGSMTVESALAYAIILAARGERSLVLTGDPSAWDRRWGKLVKAETAGSRVQLTPPLN